MGYGLSFQTTQGTDHNGTLIGDIVSVSFIGDVVFVTLIGDVVFDCIVSCYMFESQLCYFVPQMVLQQCVNHYLSPSQVYSCFCLNRRLTYLV